VHDRLDEAWSLSSRNAHSLTQYNRTRQQWRDQVLEANDMQPKHAAKYWVLLSTLIIAAGLCAYAAIFFGWWVTATPTDTPGREHASALSGAWSTGFELCLLLIVIIGLRIAWLSRKQSQR
jgi:hypothetical protein